MDTMTYVIQDLPSKGTSHAWDVHTMSVRLKGAISASLKLTVYCIMFAQLILAVFENPGW